MNWTVLSGVVLILYVSGTSSSRERRDTISNIQNGLSVAKELGGYIESQNFDNVIGKLFSSLNPFLGIVGPVISFFRGLFAPSESAELKAIKKLYKEVDSRFDKVDVEFTEVKNLINWKATEVEFKDYEEQIIAVNRAFEDIYNFPSEHVNLTTAIFVLNYDKNYHNSGPKLYDGIMNERAVFGENLLTAIMKHTENDRGKCQSFMLGLLQLMITAAKLELSYHQLNGHAVLLPQYKNQWMNRFMEVRAKMISTNNNVAAMYKTQSEIDINNYLVKHQPKTMNNNDFNNGLYGLLSTKYFWRDWLTITFKDVQGSHVHYVQECVGYGSWIHKYGRNLVVASVDSTKKHFDMHLAESIVKNVDSCKTVIGRHFGHVHTKIIRTNSDKAYNTFPASVKDKCDPYVAKGVIEYKYHNGNDVHFKAAPNRVYLRSREKCNYVYVFG